MRLCRQPIIAKALIVVMVLSWVPAYGQVSPGTINSKLQDGSGNKLTSTLNGGKQSLDVNVTSSSGGGDGAILDGVSAAIKATVLSLTNSHPLTTAIVDASGNQITSFGGGTQYANGAAQATPTGTVALGWDGANVRALSTDNTGILTVKANAGTNLNTSALLLDATLTGRIAAAFASADAIAAQTTAPLHALNMGWNAGTSKWDRMRVDSSDNLNVNLSANSFGTLTTDVSDRAARLLGKVYGSQGVALTQTATNNNLQVEVATGGTLIDPRSIRALTSSDTVTVVQGTGTNLHSVIDACTGCGLTVTDGATFTAGASSFTPSGGEYNPTAAALTSGQQGTQALTPYRSQYHTLFGSNGLEQGTRSNPINVQVASLGAILQPAMLGKGQLFTIDNFGRMRGLSTLGDGKREVSIHGAEGPQPSDVGLIVQNAVAPSLQCPYVVGISQTSSTQLVTNAGGKFLHICAFQVISGGAQNVSLVEGTGSTCGTGTKGLWGGTSASVALMANGGGGPFTDRIVIPMQVSGDNLCLLQSAASNVSGTLTYGIY